MTAKRLLSVVLSAIMIIASLATVSATETVVYSATIEDPVVDVFDVAVTVKSTVDGKMTAQLVNAANNLIYGAADSNAPTLSNGMYIYTFNFKMPDSSTLAPTGRYVIKVGNNVTKTTTNGTVKTIVSREFQYQSINDKITFYNTLDTKAAGEIKDYFAGNPTLVPVDVTEYNNLSDGTVDGEGNVLALVNAEIAALNLGVTINPGDDKEAKVSEVETAFVTAFNNAMEIALIADVSESDWETVATDAMTDTTFDNEYYIVDRVGTPGADELNDEILLDVADAYDYFKSESAAVTSLDLAEYQKAFDKAALLVITDTLDYASIKDAFLYFENKGSIEPTDMANIDALVAAEKDADLWKDLKKSAYTDAASLVANAVSIAQTMVDNGALNTPSIGGGGGGAGGSSTIDKPSTPGASMGVVSDPTMTPAEPVNPSQPEPVKGFTDLAQAEWSRKAVEYLADKGVINGKSANSFAPNDAVTREEGAKIIVAAFGLLGDAECDFADVSADRWSYAYIAAAAKHGIINGYGENFGPTDTMTREQAATIIFRAAEKISLELSGEKLEFTDAEHTSDWASDAIAHLAADGVINGMGDGTFAPKATLTRAQLAQLVYNVLVTIGGVN